MDLVKDDRLVAQAKEPDEKVPSLQHAQKGLIYRANAKRSQQAALVWQEPGHRGHRATLAFVEGLQA